MSESVTLLQNREVNNDSTSCQIHYCPQRINSKGAILCLLVRLLQSIGNGAVIVIVSDTLFVTYLMPILGLFCPIAGWIADAWLGRYQIIKVGIWTCLVGNILAVSAALISYTSASMFNHKVFQVLAYIGFSVSIIGDEAITANIIQFSLDQCLGASGDEFNAVIQWNVWVSYFVHCICTITIMSGSLLLLKYTSYIKASISIIFSITAAIVFYIVKRWLDTTHRVTNPIKLIFQVLNYARKNKYPKNRSSLTYWEEDYPSRLDLGKEKYGGPISEEEVEDVRTILQLTPLLICPMLFYLPAGKLEKQWYNYMNPSNIYWSLYSIISVTPLLAFTVLIPVFYFIINPFFNKYLPSMLKAIGTGSLLLFLSLLVQISLDIVIHIESEELQQCVYKNYTLVLPINYHWVILQMVLYAIGSVIMLVSLLVFVVAQTPEKMKGLTIGLYYTSIGIGFLIGYNIYIPFENIPSTKWLSCELYTDIAELTLFSAILMTLLILTKRYQLRMRERTINVYLITEDHYVRYMDQEEEYQRDYLLSYGSTICNQ